MLFHTFTVCAIALVSLYTITLVASIRVCTLCQCMTNIWVLKTFIDVLTRGVSITTETILTCTAVTALNVTTCAVVCAYWIRTLALVNIYSGY